MAERRMFAKSIIDSDAFLDMPVTARLLYYDLAMRADDDGFVNSPRKIMRVVGASNDDMNVLLMKKFVIAFDNGVVVIKHWRIHNYIQKDRYKPTNYKELKESLELDENGSYRMMDTKCIQSVSTSETQVRIGEDRKELESGKSVRRFTPPTIEEVKAYCQERGNSVDAQRFVDFYSSKGWKVGNSPMKDWRAAVRTWERDDKPKQRNTLQNYQEKGVSHPKLSDIGFDLSDFE